MIGSDTATAQAEQLAAPWPSCPECGETHPPEEPCYAHGVFAVARLAGEAERYAARVPIRVVGVT